MTPVALVGGTGGLGYGLAVRLAAAGVAVAIGSRDAARAADAAERVAAEVPGAVVRGSTNAEAVAGAEVAVLCVPFATHAATLKVLAEPLAGTRVLIDATVPLATAVGGRPVELVGVWHGSAAEQARALVPAGVSVVAGLHTVAAAALADLGHGLDEHVLLCGDDADAKALASGLLSRVDGLRCVDAGRLESARFVEPLTALLIGINRRYRVRAGIRIAGLPEEQPA